MSDYDDPQRRVRSKPSVPGKAPLPKSSPLTDVVTRTVDGVRRTMAGARIDVAFAYVRANEEQFLGVIVQRLAELQLPQDPRVTWRPGGFAHVFRDALAAGNAGNPLFALLPKLLHPADPMYLVDAHRYLTHGRPGLVVDGREAVGPMHWNPIAGEAIAHAVVVRARESVARMLPRYVVQLDAKHPAPVLLEDLVTSHPMDQITARLLCDERVIRPSKRARSKATPRAAADDPANFRDGVRMLKDFRWLGPSDPALWNWLHVTDPADATVEDVAATLGLSQAASHQAYGFTASPPFFRVTPSWALRIPGAKEYAPANASASGEDHALALASSEFATDAAIAQAAGERQFDTRGIPLPADLLRLQSTLERSQRQLQRAHELLAGWGLRTLVLPALEWVLRYRDHLGGIPDHRLIALAPVMEGQQQVLFEAVGAIAELVDVAQPGADGERGPITSALRSFATAAGESHLLETSRTELARARGLKAEMPLLLLEQSAQTTERAVMELRENESSLGGLGGDAAAATLRGQQRTVAALKTRQAGGEDIAPEQVELLAAELQEQAIDARVKSLYGSLHRLGIELGDAGMGPHEAVAALGTALSAARNEVSNLSYLLKEEVVERHQARKREALTQAGPTIAGRAFALREVAKVTTAQFGQFVTQHGMSEKFGTWAAQLSRQQKRTAIVSTVTSIAWLLGSSIVTGGVAGVAGGAARGAVLATAANASVGVLRASRVANATAAVVTVATDAALSAAVQTALDGGNLEDTFVDNFVANAAVRVILAPLHQVVKAYASKADDIAQLDVWRKAGRAGKTLLQAGTVLTAEMVTGAAVSYVVHRMRHGERPDEATALQWAIQGGSMAIGAFVSKWTKGFESRLVRLAEHATHLKVRSLRLKRMAREVERSGDPDVAMQLLVERQALLGEEARSITVLRQRQAIPQGTAETLEHGNLVERQAISDKAMETLPLRFAGLTPDDGSGKVWSGTSEQIATGLKQASDAGLDVNVLSAASAARQWRVRYNGRVLTLIETSLAGQPRPARATSSEGARKQAQRYAKAAAFMQDQWEAKVKAEIDALPVVQVDHIQVGFAYAGVVNQSTLPATGDGLGDKLVIYSHKGTLSKRGPQELGQAPRSLDAPGVRVSEQAPPDAEWATSDQLDHALEIGRVEAQTPAYRGSAVALEVRPRGALPADWDPAAAQRAFRVQISDGVGRVRWFYSDRVDNVGGLGPGSLAAAQRVVDPADFDALVASGRLLRGDDPEYTSKLRHGRILVWGGSPTGAWAAEPAVRAGDKVTVLGDDLASDWPALLREYERLSERVASYAGGGVPADLTRERDGIEAAIRKAHGGMTNRRNTKPGATYHTHPLRRGEGEARIEFGSPSAIARNSDGSLLVTVGDGPDRVSSTYDQVVVAHGQDPAAAGGPGALLGAGAMGADGEVPAGTIQLRPIYGAARGAGPREVLGLESIDPEGIQLKGAAFASARMAPWVEQSQRPAFVAAVRAMADEHAATRDYGPVGEDSRSVSPGMEVQRDRIPRANEVFSAKALRLPGPEHTLQLDPADDSRWDDQVREFFAIHLRARERWVSVQRLGGGRSGAVIYRVLVDRNEVGVFKLFGRDGAASEQRMLALLDKAKLQQMKVVRERGRVAVKANGFDGAILMDTAPGQSVKDMLESLPEAEGPARTEALKALSAAARLVATGLAEMHSSFDGGGYMTASAKLEDAKYMLDRDFRGGPDTERVRDVLGDVDFARVHAALEGPLLTAFLQAKLRATAYHGDANAGNFMISGSSAGKGAVSMIDVAAMQYSVDDNGRGTKTGAADVARFLGSLESLAPGALTQPEIVKVREAFMSSYNRESHVSVVESGVQDAERWYRAAMEVAALKQDPTAKARLMQIAGIEDAP